MDAVAREVGIGSGTLERWRDDVLPSGKIHRSIHENARNVARQISTTAAYEQSCRERKKVEILFAHLKRIMKLDKLRLRGFSGANDEFLLLAATAQNLRRMAKWMVNTTDKASSVPA